MARAISCAVVCVFLDWNIQTTEYSSMDPVVSALSDEARWQILELLADLTEADFERADLRRATFRNAILHAADFEIRGREEALEHLHLAIDAQPVHEAQAAELGRPFADR